MTVQISGSPVGTGTYQRRQCPLCAADSSKASVTVRSRVSAESSSFEALREQWYGFFREKSFFSYARCRQCGMLYSPVYFGAEQLTELYSSMPDNMAEVSHGALDRTQFGYFQEFRKYSDLRGNFLEIGPDVGMFVRYCVEFGRFSKYWLFEPNIAAHDKLRARLRNQNFEISTSLLDLSPVPDRSISAVAMIHVVDHISDPVSFLRQVRSKLISGARVLIVTHDERSLMPKALGARWPAYCLQHPHLFNPKTMERLLQNAGMTLMSCVKSTNYFPLSFLLKHALYVLGLGHREVPSWLAAEVPLRLGNIITIAAPAE